MSDEVLCSDGRDLVMASIVINMMCSAWRTSDWIAVEKRPAALVLIAAACLPQFAGPLLGLDQVPHVVLSPVIGIVTKAARALTPW